MPASILTFRLPASEAQPLATQLPTGRLVEIKKAAAGAQITTAVRCLRQAQAQGEPCAWLQPAGGSLFPPDLVSSGIDLQALVVVNVPKHAGPYGIAKAAEVLLRSGGFGMLVLDLVDTRIGNEGAWQGRLLGLAREHRSRLLLLSDDAAQHSLGPLVSLCIEPHRKRLERGTFQLEQHIRKDKSGLLSPMASECFRGPWGLV